MTDSLKLSDLFIPGYHIGVGVYSVSSYGTSIRPEGSGVGLVVSPALSVRVRDDLYGVETSPANTYFCEETDRYCPLQMFASVGLNMSFENFSPVYGDYNFFHPETKILSIGPKLQLGAFLFTLESGMGVDVNLNPEALYNDDPSQMVRGLNGNVMWHGDFVLRGGPVYVGTNLYLLPDRGQLFYASKWIFGLYHSF